MNKYDVVVPVFNAEKYLGAALQSLVGCVYLQQVIVVLDGPTDGSKAVAQGFEGKLPLKLVEKPNGGVSSARNVGLRESQAEYIAFLDADDVWRNDKLTIIENYMSKNPGPVDFVFSSYRCIDQDGIEIPRHAADDQRSAGNASAFQRLVEYGNFVGSPSNVVVSRRLVESIGGFDERLANGEDTDFYLRAAARYGFHFVDQELVSNRKHPDSAQTNKAKMFRNTLVFLNKWLPEYPDAALRAARTVMARIVLRDKHFVEYWSLMRDTLSDTSKSLLFGGRGAFAMVASIVLGNARYLLRKLVR